MRYEHAFYEHDTPWRRAGDVVSGRYPAFLFGARVGRCLPVFVFTEVTLPSLEPLLVYVLENGYRTLTTEELGAFVGETHPIREPSVVLCFDNAWASLWTVAAPLLRRYDMRAVAHVIPGRTPELKAPRPAWGQPGHDPDVDRTENPFCSWAELKALADEGRVDLQSNSWSHARIFSRDKFLRLIEPETRLPWLSWPVVSDPGEPLNRLSSSNVFHPLLPTRSRLSDALKHDVDPSVVRRIHDDPDAAPYLFRQHLLQVETKQERADAVRYELERSREELASRLGVRVRHLSFPWGVCGKVAGSLVRECGYETAFADRDGGRKACAGGGDPYRISRLPGRYIRALPGRPRKLFWRIRAE